MRLIIPRKAVCLCVLLLSVIISLGAERVQAQDETPTPATPDSEEVKRLKEEKTTAELRRDIAQAREAELEAKFPKPTSSPLEGKTTISDGAVIESQMVSYLSMAYAANNMVKQLKDKGIGIKNLAIYNERDVKLLQSYMVINNQLKILQDEYDKFLKRSAVNAKVAGVLTAANSFLGGFVDLISFLRTNVEIKGFTFDIEEAALVSEVFRAAKASDGLGVENLYYPAAFPPKIDINKESQILRKLEELRARRELVGTLLGALEEIDKKIKKAKTDIKDLTAAIAALKRKQIENEEEIQNIRIAHNCRPPAEARERIGRLQNENKRLAAQQAKSEAELAELQGGSSDESLAALEKEKERLEEQMNQSLIDPKKREEAAARFKSLNEQFDKIIASLLKVDSDMGVNSLTAYIIAENLNDALTRKVTKDGKDILTQEGSYWLQLKVLKAGGNNKIKTNLIVDVFTGGSRVSHSGGAIVQYILYNTQGQSIASDTFTEYTGYIKASRIKKLDNPVNVVDVPKRKLELPK